MGGILQHLDPTRFDLAAISSHRGVARLRSTMHNRAVRLLAMPGEFEQAVEAIRAERFDVLYYWEVGTDNINYFLPFCRLAPVQCTSWGVQMTSGIPQLDYYLSSELVEPEDASHHYSEKLVLASTLLTFQQRTRLPDVPKPRERFGIQSDAHWYVCAQQLGKFQPDFDAILADILRQDNRGLIVIAEDRQGPFVGNQLRARFREEIPDVADRIAFVPYQTRPDYLSLVAAADVLLDPLHFVGVNSSYDGFSMNQPIVTLPSNFQRGRYTLACYKKMGLFDCVASSPEQYAETAVALGTNADRRAAVVEKIGQASPVLFEDMQAVREHERIFTELVKEARVGRRPTTA